jgi:carboxyl-terminal processing protease
MALLLGGIGLSLPNLRAAEMDAEPSAAIVQLRREAEKLEQGKQWNEAARVYAQVLARERNLPETRLRFHQCVRRAQQARRFRDTSFRQQTAGLSLQECLDVYVEVLTQLQALYVDRDRVRLPFLFTNGLDELRLALDDENFCREQLPKCSPASIASFKTRLNMFWSTKKVRQLWAARSSAKEVALEAQAQLGLKPSCAVLELICGACIALDEYTCYLTPAQFIEATASWRGEMVGVGIELALEDQRLVIAQVYLDSSAYMSGLKPGDRVLRIGDKAASTLSLDAARDQLKGDPETIVDLEVLSPAEMKSRVVKIKRQTIHVASISEPRFLDEQAGIAYVQLVAFQETTVHELDDAIDKMQAGGMKVLVLDLRGNVGGLFEVAIQIAERFLSTGLIVSTHGQVREYNNIYRAESMNVLTVPLVVLVDGETASAAEMVAGALKDNQRGTLVGQTTFGKGSIQNIRKLSTIPAGIRLTVAKLYSPRGRPYTDNGINPDVPVARSSPMTAMDMDPDAQVQAALDLARRLAADR